MEKKLFNRNFFKNFLHSEGNYKKLNEWKKTIDLKQMQLLCVITRIQRL